MMMVRTETTDDNDNVLDLSVNKTRATNNEIVLKQNQNRTAPPSTPSPAGMKRMLDLSPPPPPTTTMTVKPKPTGTVPTNKRPLRFQCKHCDYKAPSTSLMQNHIYRHTDLTPYACAYCGHKSTTKSTIMVHIELCHPNMEVKIIENRVREQDFYRDLNSTEISSSASAAEEPIMKKQRRSNQNYSHSAPINGVAISLKALIDDDNASSPASDGTSETENLEPLPFDDGIPQHVDAPREDSFSGVGKHSLTINYPSQSIPMAESSASKDSDSEDGSEYLVVYNRPKQYYGSLYEPDKQYACKLCSYTTNHRPSMEDHVFVHTDEKPYKCGYCGEEIFTRYAATYHIKYKHAGMARNFIQNKADVTQYYVNRAKREDEKNQFKVIDTRRVKVPARHSKSVMNQQNKVEHLIERSLPPVSASSPATVVSSSPPSQVQTPHSHASTSSPNEAQTPPDYRLLLAWSYYLASQAAWLSPMFQQQGQLPSSLPTDPQACAKFLQQAMQTAMDPSRNGGSLPNNEQSATECQSRRDQRPFAVKEEANGS